MKPHKHAELIKAWADGQAEVEYRYPKDDGSWSLWKDLTQCVFHDWYEYRIKPEITQFNTQLHPLTDEEILSLTGFKENPYDIFIEYEKEDLIEFARAILRKAQEK
jgi:hypothetical protein